MTNFGTLLKQIRLEKNLSQDEFAIILGTTKQVISRYENGQRSPKVSTVADFAARLGLPVCRLLGESKVNSLPETNDPQETELVTIYRELNARGQDALMRQARYLNSDPDMKKGSTSNTETA